MSRRKCLKLKTVTFLLSAVIFLWWILNTWLFTDRYLVWRPSARTDRQIDRQANSKYYVPGRDEDIYIYSAIANAQPSWGTGDLSVQVNDDVTEIVVTSLDRTRASFDCCVLMKENRQLLITPASDYYRHRIHRLTKYEKFLDYLYPKYYVARQLACWVPRSLSPTHITLTSSSSCSSDITDYLRVLYPPRVPGGLALCAKIAHSGGLDPEKVIEWFEVQRILGVDKILIYDLGNPGNLNRVFRHYQSLGILDLQPYELPGYPKNRSLKERWKRTPQFEHDETLAVLECRQRMSGYDYVISHDVDEFIIPREDIPLKRFIKEKLKEFPEAAGFYFFTAFFITTWSPTHPREDLMVKRYRKTRVPRWEACKYLYLPSRVVTSITHEFFTKNSYTGPVVPVDQAYLHHYRACPKDTWGTCSVQTVIDHTMTRYRDLELRVREVRNATLTSPKWQPRSRKG